MPVSLDSNSTTTVNIQGNEADKAVLDLAKQQSTKAVKFDSVVANPLKRYSNVSYLWLLAPLDPLQIANESYFSDSGLKYIVLASGGARNDDNETGRVSTFYGKPEYFIDNVEINTINAPTKDSGLSGTMNVSFDVTEPYSLGLFIQSLQSAAIRAGYDHYADCPWLLKLSFVGYTPAAGLKDPIQEKITEADRYYTLKLTSVNFTANEGGSKYRVKMIDFSLEAFNNVIGIIDSSVTVTGGTVKEAMESLTKAINDDQEVVRNAKGYSFVNDYSIEFADEIKGALNYGKLISQSKFKAGMDTGGNRPKGDKSQSEKNNADSRDNRASTTKREFPFPKTTPPRRITDIIETIMKESDYCVNALNPENVDKKTGYIKWYRISAKVTYRFNKYIKEKDNNPRFKISYVISPYLVHHSVVKPPTASTIGVDNLLKTIKKKYNYLYTGLNDDVIRWDLKFDNTFYTAIATGSLDNQPGTQGGRTAETKIDSSKQDGAGDNSTSLITHQGRLHRDRSGSYTKPMGGASADDIDIRIARMFEEAILLDTEMITLEMDILGDPYYLTPSGSFVLSHSPTAQGSMIKNNGTMASEEGEVRVYVSFRTPIDAPVDGSLFIFPDSGIMESPFSGLYKIKSVKSKFAEGMFKQTLSLFRDRGQQPEDLKAVRTDANILLASQPSTPTTPGVQVFAVPNQQVTATSLPPAAASSTNKATVTPAPD